MLQDLQWFYLHYIAVALRGGLRIKLIPGLLKCFFRLHWLEILANLVCFIFITLYSWQLVNHVMHFLKSSSFSKWYGCLIILVILLQCQYFIPWTECINDVLVQCSSRWLFTFFGPMSNWTCQFIQGTEMMLWKMILHLLRTKLLFNIFFVLCHQEVNLRFANLLLNCRQQ